jgi:phosphatidylserine decarboxylase
MKTAAKKLVTALYGIALFCIGKAPSRTIPDGDSIISPAHGKIIEIKTVETPDILFEKKGIENRVLIPEISFPAKLIAIEMTPLDIHVQRAPISGTVFRVDHHRGKHKNAMGKGMYNLVEENEKSILIIGNEKEKVAVIQVAGIAARRIRNIAEVGDQLGRGSIYGRILFGSQVVIIIPHNRKLCVELGQRTIDGETVLAS